MWLEVLSGEDAGRVVEVPEGRAFVVGRVQGADLVVRDARASRMHAELTVDGETIALHDLDSANGTLVDGERVMEATLRDGQRITIGDVAIAVLAREPAVTGAPIAEAVRPEAQAEGPTWSMVGRLVEHRTRRGRRLTYAAVAAAAAALAALAVVLVTRDSDDERAAETVRAVAPGTLRVDATG
ncbi:MAG: FHA domain-containing protein, partial [Solirubrobacteraceae bacterium]